MAPAAMDIAGEGEAVGRYAGVAFVGLGWMPDSRKGDAHTHKVWIRIVEYPDIRYTSPILPLSVSTRWQFLSICQIIFDA